MKILTVIIILFSANVLLSQEEPHPLEFFPHHLGDIFEYYTDPICETCPADSFQNIITKDSLDENGLFYVETTFFGNLIIDTNNFEVISSIAGGGLGYGLLFKLDADSGESWTVYRDGEYSEKAEVTNIFPAIIFNEEVLVKAIQYSDSASGLYYWTYWLSSKYGIISQYGDPPWEPTYYLRGAKVDGKIYGTITSVKKESDFFTKGLTLFQNYPNPFNPATTISYQLLNNSNVKLIIYNTLGEEVTTLIDEYQIKGTHKIKFEINNVNGFSSGVYFYQVITNEGSLIKKMLFIK